MTVLAVDIPSGVVADTGTATPGRHADVTVTFGALKPGLLLGRGAELAGTVIVEPIGLDVGTPAQHLVEDDDLGWLPGRDPLGNKWDSAVYVVAGSPGMFGAAALAASGAIRAGAGMVRLGSPGVEPGTIPVVEAVARAVPASDWAGSVLDELARCEALVVGPGLGRAAEATKGILELRDGGRLPGRRGRRRSFRARRAWTRRRRSCGGAVSRPSSRPTTGSTPASPACRRARTVSPRRASSRAASGCSCC